MRKVLVVLLIASVLVLALSVPALAKPCDPDRDRNEWGMLYKYWKTRNVDNPLSLGQQIQLDKEVLAGMGLTWGQVNSLKLFPPGM